MITYNKIGWGLPLLLRMYGSAFPRSFPAAAISAGVTVLFYLTIQDADERWWGPPYPYQIFAYIVGFIVIFRSNFGYSRYWEGRTWFQNMTAAWVDACIQVGSQSSSLACRILPARHDAVLRIAASMISTCQLVCIPRKRVMLALHSGLHFTPLLN